jgi:hypothetical protein
MALTYDELVRRIPLWLYASNRPLVDEMSVIIEQAEDQLLQVMDHDLFQTKLSGGLTVSPGSAEIDLTNRTPRVLETRAFRKRLSGTDDPWLPLQKRDMEYLTALFSGADYNQGVPRYYATDGEVLRYRVFPTPDQTYDIEVTANVEFIRLGPAQQTNVLTEEFPRAMEKACLRQAAVFQRDAEDEARYEKEMMAALAEANAQTGRRRRDEVGTKPRDTNNASGS